jgi:hypothetical protein
VPFTCPPKWKMNCFIQDSGTSDRSVYAKSPTPYR